MHTGRYKLLPYEDLCDEGGGFFEFDFLRDAQHKVTIINGVLPDYLSGAPEPFRSTTVQDETNPAVVYRLLE